MLSRAITYPNASDVSRARLAAIVRSSADAIVGETLEGIVTDWNPAAERLYGYAASEIIGQHFSVVIPPNRMPEAEAVRARVCRGESVEGVETVRRTKDGRTIHVALTISPVWDDSGTLIANSTIVRDITAAKASEARYRDVVEQVPAIIYTELHEPDSVVSYMSRYVETLLGIPPEAFIGAPGLWLERVHPDDRQRVRVAEYQMRQSGSAFAADYRMVAADGRTVWIRDVERLVHDDAGRPVCWQGVALDVTAHKQLERDLMASEARFRTLVEQLPGAIYLLAADEEQTPLYFSPYIEALTGETPKEAMVLHSHWHDLIHPEDRERVAEEDQRTGALGEPCRVVYRHRRKDGGYVWVQDECVPVHDEAGAIVAWQGVILDVTDRIQTEQALAASETRFRTAFANAPIGMTLVSSSGHVLQANAAICAMLGYREDEIIGRHFQEFTHPDDLEPSLELTRSTLAGERQTFELEKRYLRKDGEVVWVQVSASLVRDANGPPFYLIAQIQDITGRKATEQALADSEVRFRTAFEDAPIGMALTDPRQGVLQVNRALCAMLGYAEEELKTRTLRGLTHPNDVPANRALVERALAGEIDSFELEKRYLHKNGQIVWAHLRVSLVRDERGTPLYFISQTQDITERKQSEDELRAALEAAQSAMRARSQFLAVMSHELRTPMQAVLGYGDVLRTELADRLTPEQADDFLYIRQGADRMITLVDQMLDLSRIDAGRLDLDVNPVDLDMIIEQVRQDVAPQAAGKGLQLRVELPERLPTVMGDAVRLRQILLNLAANAVKFTQRGSVTLSAKLTDVGVAIAVIDTGIGIAPENLHQIFEEFRQVDSGLARRYSGAGLGLAIARKLAEQHGGSIGVTSQPQVGSTFTLYLPISARKARGDVHGHRMTNVRITTSADRPP